MSKRNLISFLGDISSVDDEKSPPDENEREKFVLKKIGKYVSDNLARDKMGTRYRDQFVNLDNTIATEVLTTEKLVSIIKENKLLGYDKNDNDIEMYNKFISSETLKKDDEGLLLIDQNLAEQENEKEKSGERDFADLSIYDKSGSLITGIDTKLKKKDDSNAGLSKIKQFINQLNDEKKENFYLIFIGKAGDISKTTAYNYKFINYDKVNTFGGDSINSSRLNKKMLKDGETQTNTEIIKKLELYGDNYAKWKHNLNKEINKVLSVVSPRSKVKKLSIAIQKKKELTTLLENKEEFNKKVEIYLNDNPDKVKIQPKGTTIMKIVKEINEYETPLTPEEIKELQQKSLRVDELEEKLEEAETELEQAETGRQQAELDLENALQEKRIKINEIRELEIQMVRLRSDFFVDKIINETTFNIKMRKLEERKDKAVKQKDIAQAEVFRLIRNFLDKPVPEQVEKEKEEGRRVVEFMKEEQEQKLEQQRQQQEQQIQQQRQQQEQQIQQQRQQQIQIFTENRNFVIDRITNLENELERASDLGQDIYPIQLRLEQSNSELRRLDSLGDQLFN
jgi:hypothetical protein